MIVLFLLFALCGYAQMSECYRPLPNKLGSSGMSNIDYIYLINLDKRPERWNRCLEQLIPYGIFPERFPAIYGWSLTPEILNKMSVRFVPGMWSGRESVMHFPPEGDGSPQWVWISEAFYGKCCFSGWTVKGTIGCSLSHFSVLKDAYDSGYETIWVMEDDIWIPSDPHELSDLIEELDQLVGHDEWDVLYTDLNYLVVDPTKDIDAEIPVFYWRPDMPNRDVRFLAEHQNVGEHFMKIGSRMRQHSVIYRRCGIEKILKFYEERGNFLPYDTEIALIPEIRLYTLKKNIVTIPPNEVLSDTRGRYFHE
jgi:GR25 family glycosyltransferase involved in LPS biosynthesis